MLDSRWKETIHQTSCGCEDNTEIRGTILGLIYADRYQEAAACDRAIVRGMFYYNPRTGSMRADIRGHPDNASPTLRRCIVWIDKAIIHFGVHMGLQWEALDADP